MLRELYEKPLKGSMPEWRSSDRRENHRWERHAGSSIIDENVDCSETHFGVTDECGALSGSVRSAGWKMTWNIALCFQTLDECIGLLRSCDAVQDNTTTVSREGLGEAKPDSRGGTSDHSGRIVNEIHFNFVQSGANDDRMRRVEFPLTIAPSVSAFHRRTNRSGGKLIDQVGDSRCSAVSHHHGVVRRTRNDQFFHVRNERPHLFDHCIRK